MVGSGSIPSGAVGYWPIDETSGNLVADASGHGNNGTAYNTSIVSGKIGTLGSLIRAAILI